MTAYLGLVEKMMRMFCVLSLIMLPAIIIYARTDALMSFRNYDKARFSMGNLGFSSA